VPSDAPLSADDAFGITNVVHKLFHCMDGNLPQLFAAQFTDDGVCEVALTGAKAEGPEALGALCTALHLRFHPARHYESNITIDGAGSVATNYSYWTAVSGADTIATGVHEDMCVMCCRPARLPAAVVVASLARTCARWNTRVFDKLLFAAFVAALAPLWTCNCATKRIGVDGGR
jgi:hypothetical protein